VPRTPEEDARASLEPLAQDERPAALLIAVAVCIVLALAVLAGAATINDLSRHGGSLPGAALLAVTLGLMALAGAAASFEAAFRAVPQDMDIAFEAAQLVAEHHRAVAALRAALEAKPDPA